MKKIGRRIGLGLMVAMLSLSAFVSSASATANTAVVDAARSIATDQRDTIEAVLPYIVLILAVTVGISVVFWFASKGKRALK